MKKIKEISKKFYCFIFGHDWIKSKMYNYKQCLNCDKIVK
jgi:hypothetical protein